MVEVPIEKARLFALGKYFYSSLIVFNIKCASLAIQNDA